MNKVLLSLLLLLLTTLTDLHAQSVVGNWKRTSLVLTDKAGKVEDMLPAMTRSIPCTTEITYSFLANGTMQTNVPGSCGTMKATIERMNQSAQWSLRGDKLMITVMDKSYPDSQYVLTTSGNTMTWTLDYTANPQVPNPTNTKKLVIHYQRL